MFLQHNLQHTTTIAIATTYTGVLRYHTNDPRWD